jgi:SPP1 gp7 family putative phage head morphogenesis protein
MPFSKRQIRRITDPDLIPRNRWPSLAGRVCESWLKRRLFAVEDAAVRDQFRMFQAANRDIREAALLLADEYGLGTLDSSGPAIEWRNRVMGMVETRLDTLYEEVARHAAEHAMLAYYVGFYGRAWLLDSITTEDTRVIVPTLNGADTLARILRPDRFTEQFDAFDDLIWNMMGAEWQQRFALEKADVILRIRRAIGQAQTQGLGIRDSMNLVSSALGVDTDRRKAGRRTVVGPRGGIRVVYNRPEFRANFNRVQTLTRTSMLTASNDGALALYNENADVVAQVEWLTARDERVCRICQALDGQTWPLDDPERLHPPGDSHPNCRCTIIPVVVDLESLLPPATPPRQTFGEWVTEMGLSWLLGRFIGGRRLDSERIA